MQAKRKKRRAAWTRKCLHTTETKVFSTRADNRSNASRSLNGCRFMLPITISRFWAGLRGLGRRHTVRDHWDEPSARRDDAARVVEHVGAAALPGYFDIDKIAAVNAALTERLWRLAFTAPAPPETWPAADLDVRGQVAAALGGARVNGKFLPRRPTLMPQLMRAMEDPKAATERLSRIVAHDPVLAADVLKLANSSRFRTTSQPIETIQRAIVVMGVDALRGLLAVAMMQPVFRASRNNFPRFPRMLWERTERAARAAEAFALRMRPEDRFEAQLSVLLSALGPLAVYGATLDVYAQSPGLTPNPALCVELASTLGSQVALRIAHQWETSTRLAAAIERSSREPLAQALCVGELAGTLALLESQQLIAGEEAIEIAHDVNLDNELLEHASARAA
jgi:HD-like signal output (HDOD) protein